MSLDDALFLIERGDTRYKVSGSDISSKTQDGDKILVDRDGQIFSTTSPFDKILDTDLVLSWKDDTNYKVTGANFKTLFLPEPVALILPVIRREGTVGSYDTIKYELVSNSEWNRPSQSYYARWSYYRGNSWYDKTDPGGYYFFDPNVEKVKYKEMHNFEGTYYTVESEEMDFIP